MKTFPTDFVSQTVPITESMLPKDDAALLSKLNEQGYEVHGGLTEAYVADIMQMCLQPSIKEYCPNDCSKRFKDLAATARWLNKGREAILLLKQESGSLSLAGYGWAGSETSPHVNGGETTFAIRIGEADQGHGLATPYCRLIVAGSSVIYGAKNYWAETWASDSAAVHIYHKIGFADVHQQADSRPTASGATVEDVRLYMRLPNNLLP